MDDRKPLAVPLTADFKSPEPLSDYAIQMIHAGLLIPNQSAWISMSREIRMWRGHPHPDAA